MTEQEIERTAERRMNMLDRNLIVGNINQESLSVTWIIGLRVNIKS
jgi:hypothetical protein